MGDRQHVHLELRLHEEDEERSHIETSRLLAGATLALVVLASSSAAQPLLGALAVDESQGEQWGWAVDYETSAAAGAAALRECGSGCAVVLTFARCGAYAANQANASTAFGWAQSHGLADESRQRALAECRSRGGSECLVRAWGCNGPVVEERLRLDQAARRRIQEDLGSAGFDPGGTDGLFGPWTRAAIRGWQSAQGRRATGYLDAGAVESLRSGAMPSVAAVPQAAPAAGPSQAPASPSASAELEGLFWQSIMNSTNPAEFEAYLQQFPNGVFRALAEARLAALRERPNDLGPGRVAVGSTADAAPDARRTTLGLSIDFGDDTGGFAQDGECDDPRFEGPDVSNDWMPYGEDATDCRRLYEAGRISLVGVDLVSGHIDFGDDAGSRALDGECDDSRFEGAWDSLWGKAGQTPVRLYEDLRSNRGHDATDCRRLYDAGRIRLGGVR